MTRWVNKINQDLFGFDRATPVAYGVNTLNKTPPVPHSAITMYTYVGVYL